MKPFQRGTARSEPEEIPPGVRPSNVPPDRPEPFISDDDEGLSDDALHAIAEGRADHAAGRTFTMDEIKRELGIEF